MLRLTAPGKLPDGREFTDFLLHKFFEQRLFNAGRFVLLPMAEKGHQFVQNDTLVSNYTSFRQLYRLHNKSLLTTNLVSLTFFHVRTIFTYRAFLVPSATNSEKFVLAFPPENY